MTSARAWRRKPPSCTIDTCIRYSASSIPRAWRPAAWLTLTPGPRPYFGDRVARCTRAVDARGVAGQSAHQRARRSRGDFCPGNMRESGRTERWQRILPHNRNQQPHERVTPLRREREGLVPLGRQGAMAFLMKPRILMRTESAHARACHITQSGCRYPGRWPGRQPPP